MRDYSAVTRNQMELWESFNSHLYTLFGGAKGGGKTVGAARVYQWIVSSVSGARLYVMREHFTTLKLSTQTSFGTWFDPALVIKKTTDYWECVNDNTIIFYAADITRDPNYEKLRGQEATAVFVDEASQFPSLFYETLPSLLRHSATIIDTGKEWTGHIILASNPVPGLNWLKRYFIDPTTRVSDGSHNFIRSLPTDNPLLPEGYIDKAFSTMSDTQLRMLKFGDWNVDDSEFTLIPSRKWQGVQIDSTRDHKAVAFGIDVGLGQPDVTVVYGCNSSGHFFEVDSFEEYDTYNQFKRISKYLVPATQGGARVFIDATGIGKGLADQLSHVCKRGSVDAVMFGEGAVIAEWKKKQKNVTKYKNRRAQLYFELALDVDDSARLINAGDGDTFVVKHPIRIVENDALTLEIQNTYYIPDDKFQALEPKKLISERLGHSPDFADALALCNGARRAYNKKVSFAPSQNERKTRTRTTSRFKDF